jgi:tetraacyldisaccharide 4'-kinase
MDERLARRGGAIELLRVPAAVFEVAARARGALYDTGLFRAYRVGVPVVSVGNLTAGGTGKTPAVAWLARELEQRGFRVGLLSRGYAARGADQNDEALVLAELAPAVLHVLDADRVRGARALVERGSSVVVLDDGFQHRRLARDLDLVLVDATRPWGLARDDHGDAVRALLPRGLLREPPCALARADAIVITRSDQLDARAVERLTSELQALAPGAPIATAIHRPVAVRGPDGERSPPESLAGREVDLTSAVGNPEAFASTVRALGATIGEHRRFADHHEYVAEDLRDLPRPERWLLCTSKDAVKLRPLGIHVRELEVRFEIASGRAVLEALLDGLPSPSGAGEPVRRLERGSLA